MKFPILTAVLLSSVAVSACNVTQAPAQVVIKGNNFYGTPNAAPIKVAHKNPRDFPTSTHARYASLEPAIPVEHKAPGASQQRPSRTAQAPAAVSTQVHQSVEMPQVTVTDLAPLTASASEPAEPTMESQTIASNDLQEVAPMEPLMSEPEILPEPQARAVANSKTIPEPSAATASKGFIWPVKGKIISGFGPTADGEYNDGINIAAQQGEPIVAAADGEVVYSGNELRGYGNMVIVRHDNGLMTAYAHADRILVSKGERVRQGVTIATVGKSGGVDQSQVHFGIRKNKEPVDPMTVLGHNNYASR